MISLGFWAYIACPGIEKFALFRVRPTSIVTSFLLHPSPSCTDAVVSAVSRIEDAAKPAVFAD